jgi:hypothetical protein
MLTTDEIARERQRVGAALAMIDAEREKLAGQLADLETTERVLARYGKAARAPKQGAAATPRAKTAAPTPPAGQKRATAAKSAGKGRRSPTLGDRVLALATGKTQQEITTACKGARPNHVGVVISRHKRAGRIEEREGKLYARQSAATASAATA